MLDIKFIRENKELVEEAGRKKHIPLKLDELIALDDRRKVLLQTIEEKRTIQNAANLQMKGKFATEDDRLRIIREMSGVKEEAHQLEEQLKAVMADWQKLMLTVPNVPDMSVPDGESDADNKEVKKFGDIKQFNFEPKSHIEIMETLGMLDLERGVKVSGFRGYFLKGDGALLSFAIWQAALEHFLSKGFTPYIVPSMVKRENLLGSGYIPQGEEDLYKTQDGDYLAGTAEVATMGYYADEILEKKDLPQKFLSFSPCFRREAGSHGKDVKGLIRVHEFYKLEQVVLCEGSHEQSVQYHEEINRNTEEFIEKLGLPYHTVINCGGDLGLGQVKKYDIELWVPKEGTYREISSASYFHDFQTRRFNIKYRDDDGKLRYAHSLNSTAIPTPRILVSLVENFQEEDGSITIPPILRPYLGDREKIEKK